MGKARARAKAQVTLDAGALIAIDRGDRRMIALVEEVLDSGGRFQVPVGALSQAWRNGQTQAKLARFVRGAEVQMVPLDEALARACGELLAATGTSDVIDASVVIVARQHHALICTSDVADLKALDKRAVLVRV